MVFKGIIYVFVQLLFTAAVISGQVYRADYKKLNAPLLDKDPPVICILEHGSSLFDTLGHYPEFTNKYTCYSPNALSELQNLLKVNKFDPEDKKFIRAVRDKLSIGYIVNWNASPDSNGIYLLDIFSTGTSSRVYTKKFFPSINSNPFEDARKLLIDDLEVFYKLAYGELLITVDPDSARFILMNGEKPALEWKGNFRQQMAAGKYKLLSEAENFISQEKEIEIQEGTVTSVNILLKPQFAELVKMIPATTLISNLKTEFTNQEMKIIYDLAGKGNSVFDMELTLIEKKTGNVRDIKMIYGDVKKVKPGSNKTIIWQMLQELGTLPVDEYEIKLSAGKSGVPWYYYAGGAALLGGVTLLLGGGSDENPGTSTIKAGTPPGRP